jgi:hypothetical protein
MVEPSGKPTAARRIPGVPDTWQHFLLCMVFHILLPLLPLGIEWWSRGTLSTGSATVVASLYAVGIGGSSRSRLLFGLGIVVSIIFAVAFGRSLAENGSLEGSVASAEAAIAFMLVCHTGERYNRHVAERSPFWKFSDEEA